VTRATLPRPALPPELDPRAPRRRRSPLKRLSLVTCALLSVIVLALTSVGWALYRQFDSKVTRVSWTIDGPRPEEAAGDENILLLGDDSRDGTGGEYGQVQGVRSDTTIIAHFSKEGTATLLSFPRDTLMTVTPKVKGTPSDGRDKLTNILTYADVPGLMSTLEEFTGLKINHVISIDLAGFKTMTDAVGGVTVCVTRLPDGSTRNLNDEWSQWHGQLGENNLNGDQALAFVRTRHALGDERLRILRQQQFLSKLLAKATSTGTLTSPGKLTSLLSAVGGALKLDSGLDQTELLRLAKRVSKLGSGKITFVTVPTHVPLPGTEGATDDKGTIPPHGNVLLANTTELETILAPLRPAPVQDPALASAPAVPPAKVTVSRVVNDSGRNGLATKTAADLRSLGFSGAMTPSTGASSQVATEIRYPAGQAAAAKALVARIPGAQAVLDSTLTSGLSLVLGSSFTGVAGGTTSAGTGGTAGGAATSAAAGSAAGATTPSAGGSAAAGTPALGGAPANTSCTP
jgi:LCP family protein required for cell wall assembly